MALTAHQKLGLVVFIVLGIATMAFGAMRMQQVIAGPFEKDPTASKYRTLAQIEDEREEQLKTRDSDNDGLTDYDEMRIFRTSPFLEDSDSDGIPDGTEIAQSTDPNCPKGKTCREASIDVAPTEPTATGAGSADAGAATAPTDAEAIALAITETFGDVRTLTPDSIAATLAAMPSADLRAFLLQLGIPPTALDQADDATLRALLQQTMEEIVAGTDVAPQ